MDIHVYALRGNVAAVKAEIEKGVDINSKGEISGCTALQSAARRGHIDVVTCLLKYGADIYRRSIINRTVLHGVFSKLYNAPASKLPTYYDIIRLVLIHEARIRIRYPRQYIRQPMLRQMNSTRKGGKPEQLLRVFKTPSSVCQQVYTIFKEVDEYAQELQQEQAAKKAPRVRPFYSSSANLRRRHRRTDAEQQSTQKPQRAGNRVDERASLLNSQPAEQYSVNTRHLKYV